VRMAVPCSIDRCAVGAPRANDAQVIAEIIGGTVRLDRQPLDVSGFLTSGAELMARLVGLPGSVSGFAQRDPGRQVMGLELLSPACAHLCCGARRLPPRWPEP